MLQDDGSIVALTSTRVVKVEHHQDGSSTLSLSRPNICLHIATSELGSIDAVLYALRKKHHNRYRISGRFMLEESRHKRNLRWAEILSRAQVIDRREPAAKKRGRPRKTESAINAY